MVVLVIKEGDMVVDILNWIVNPYCFLLFCVIFDNHVNNTQKIETFIPNDKIIYKRIINSKTGKKWEEKSR